MFRLKVVHFFSSLSRAYKTYTGGEGVGSKVDVCFYQNLKMTILFHQNHHCIAVLSVLFWGEGEGLQKEYVFYARENDEKMDDSYITQNSSMSTLI